MSDLFERFGAAKLSHQTPNEIHLTDGQRSMRISAPAANIFRIQAVYGNTPFQDATYAVPNPQSQPLETVSIPNGRTLLSGWLQCHVSLHPALSLSFTTENGQVINADDPGLGIAWQGTEVTNYKVLQPGERFLGLGEKTGPLDRRGNQYRNWNTDQFAYGPESDPLYFSCPFYIGLHEHGAYGIFFDNTFETRFNFGASNHRFSFFQAVAGELNYYLIGGPTVADVVQRYAALTGTPPLPPLWSLGYQQCRYSYYPQHEIKALARTFRDKQIPADTLYLDIHYMRDYKVFTWNDERFPNPSALCDELREDGFSVVVIVDPGINTDANYAVARTGIERNAFVKYPDGTLYQGQAWPGWCYFPDFTDAQTRDWWQEWFEELCQTGIRGFWNDMNEPAVWGKQFPDAVQFALDGQGGTHKQAHNIYGMQMSRATREGAERYRPNERPFILTRAGFSGSQRYTAVWTGDNISNDDHLMLGCRLVNSLGLAAISFTGNDIGGFIGEASPALFMRWVAVGAFHPLFRGHTMVNSRDAEPWSFGEECEDVARNYISLRYRMLPYFYSLMHESSTTGLPAVRTLAFEFAQEWQIFQPPFDSQFMLGRALLIRPVRSDETLVKTYLPQGTWYDFFTDEQLTGGREHIVEAPFDKLPVFARGGSLFTMQSQVQHTAQPHDGTLTVHLYAGDMAHTFSHYEDDGLTTAHEQGDFHQRLITHATNGALHFEAPTGKRKSAFERVRVYLHGFAGNRAQLDGRELEVHREDYRFVQPVSSFDPWEWQRNDPKVVRNLGYVEFAYPQGAAQMVIE